MTGRSGGGAAVSSGVNYQNRVAAYILAASLCDVPLPELGNGGVLGIGFETAEGVDDLNVELSDGVYAYLQAKRKLSFSTGAKSEMHSVLDQFVRQFTDGLGKKLRLYLVTTSGSSQKITGTMRAALDAFRLGPEDAFRRDQPQAVRGVIDDLLATVSEIIGGEEGTARKCAKALLRNAFVWVLDLEEGSCLEQATVLTLHAKRFISPPLVWAKLISDCVSHSSLRHTIAVPDVRRVYERFVAPVEPFESGREAQALGIDVEQFDFCVGRELVLGTLSGVPSDDLFLFEFRRFDDDCNERVRFEDGRCLFGDGGAIGVVRRTATYEGMARFLNQRPDLVDDRKLFIAPLRDEDTERGICSERHRAAVRNALACNDDPLKCLRCGKPVSSSPADVIECGAGRDLRVGLTHSSCTRVDDRVLGVPKGDFFTRFDYLVNFHANLWLKAAQRGQGVFASRGLYEGWGTIAWSGRRSTLPPGDFVIEYKLTTGLSEFAHQRGRIHRFTREEADRAVAIFNSGVSAAREDGDPICVSEQSRAFGRRSILVKLLGVSEQLVEVGEVLATRFRQEIANAYSVWENWYAPLAYLRASEDGSTLTLGKSVPLLTDPFALNRYLENWRSGGITIPQYEVMILENDGEFDDFALDADGRGLELIVDPLFGPPGAPGFSRGIRIRPKQRILQSSPARAGESL